MSSSSPVFFYNSLTRLKEEFKPQRKGKVKLYSCGPTVYDSMHIGHAKAYSAWDVLVRFLRWKGYAVKWVMNFTDVGHLTDDADSGEDKLAKRASEKRISPWDLAEHFIDEFYRDIDAMNIQRVDVYTRATDFIKEMIEFNLVLIKKGFAYEVGGSVYFDTSKFKKYGKELMPTDVTKQLAGARISINSSKKNPSDFALWIKSDPKHIMKWRSPWGMGYPGWHLECSAMSLHHFSPTLDIHTGGFDHLMLHHPNEIAQSEAFTGKKFCNYWLHNYFITVNGEKMSKSLGNYYTAGDMISKHGGELFRAYLISSHYRTQIDFNEDNIGDAKEKLERLYKTLELIDVSKGGTKKTLVKHIAWVDEEFDKAMSDDLNTPRAISALLKFSKLVNGNLDNDKQVLLKARNKLVELGRVLGLVLERKIHAGMVSVNKKIKLAESWSVVKEKLEESMSKKVGFNEWIKKAIVLRENARRNKEYDLSDSIRKELQFLKISLEDTKNGIKWKIE